MKGKHINPDLGFSVIRLLVTITILITAIVPLSTLTVTPVKAQTNDLFLKVISANDSPTYGILKVIQLPSLNILSILITREQLTNAIQSLARVVLLWMQVIQLLVNGYPLLVLPAPAQSSPRATNPILSVVASRCPKGVI